MAVRIEKRAFILMNLVADLHSHTIVSTHAFSTIVEMATCAKKQGLYAMAVTDHGPLMPDSPHPWYFQSIRQLPYKMEGVWVLKGMEANVSNVDGDLDFTNEKLATLSLDWVIASIHSDVVLQPLSYNQVTQLWENVAHNPYVDMIGHCELKKYAFDYDHITKIFAAQNKVVEMNASSAVVRPGNEQNMRDIALACKKNGTYISVNSDAHSIYMLAQCSHIFAMLKEVEFPKELIINVSKENLITALKNHNKKIARYMEEENE